MTLHEPTLGICVECSRHDKIIRFCEDSAPSTYICSTCWTYRYDDPMFEDKLWVRKILKGWAISVIYFIIFERSMEHGTPFRKPSWS